MTTNTKKKRIVFTKNVIQISLVSGSNRFQHNFISRGECDFLFLRFLSIVDHSTSQENWFFFSVINSKREMESIESIQHSHNINTSFLCDFYFNVIKSMSKLMTTEKPKWKSFSMPTWQSMREKCNYRFDVIREKIVYGTRKRKLQVRKERFFSLFVQ